MASENGKYRLSIEQDPYASSPREHDNVGTMVCWHRRYNLGDEQVSASDEKPDARVVLPLYLYDHSGITISTKPFSCGFDSGQVGWIYMTDDKIVECLGDTAAEPLVEGDEQYMKLVSYLESEVAVYDAYLRGDVWGFQLFKLNTCEHCKHVEAELEDSCWGFIDVDGDAKEAIREHLDDEAKPLLDQAWEERV